MFIENTEYEILTPTGWQDFKGLTKTENKTTYRLTLTNDKFVEATDDHHFFINDSKVKLQDIQIGDIIDTVDGPTEVRTIEKLLPSTVYNIIEVTNADHKFIVNNCFITKNCDEFSYVQPNIAEAFWTSISPTLSTGGRAIITSTPNSDEDMFATIWKESQDKTDEFGNIREDGIGKNGFFGFRSYWYEHPDRDEAWKQRELNKIGEENFRREFECCGYDSIITLQDSNSTTFNISIGELFDQFEESYWLSDVCFKNNLAKYQVLTPTGFQSFEGIACMGSQVVIEISFSNNQQLQCTLDHKIYINTQSYLYAYQLELGNQIISEHGLVTVTGIIELDKEEPVYDLIEVSNGHCYYTSSIVSSNCEFLVYDETLISPSKLSQLHGRDPISKTGQVRWYKKPSPGHVYLVALDPSMGTGGNNSAIEIFELPDFIQVGEWHHNITPIQSQVKLLRDVLKYIQNQIGLQNVKNIYWSCENNAVGEAALVVVSDLGEDTFPGYFLSEPVKKGHIRKYRKGFNTTYGNKITACSRLKFLIEEDKMKLYSYTLISELKSYVSSGTSFRAKSGSMDDLVSALLLVVRMSVVLADWDPQVFESLNIQDDFNTEWVDPLPIFISSHG